MNKKTLIPVIMMLLTVVVTVLAVTCGKQTEKKANIEIANGCEEMVSNTEPVHVHIWKEHTATGMAWVSNIVDVDDFETRTVAVVGALFSCNCGFETTDSKIIKQHAKDHTYANEQDNFGIKAITETQQVKVGSHEEDHGYFESGTYVDYYYCDCGATK